MYIYVYIYSFIHSFIHSFIYLFIYSLHASNRRYRIHELNTEDLILCMLSQHDTNVFARCIELSTIDGKKRRTWSFLSGVKLSGVPLSRTLLVKQVQQDTALLALLSHSYVKTIMKLAITDDRQTSSSSSSSSPSLLMDGFNACLSLYTAIIIEVVKMKPLSDAQLRTIFPLIIRYAICIHIYIYIYI